MKWLQHPALDLLPRQLIRFVACLQACLQANSDRCCVSRLGCLHACQYGNAAVCSGCSECRRALLSVLVCRVLSVYAWSTGAWSRTSLEHVTGLHCLESLFVHLGDMGAQPLLFPTDLSSLSSLTHLSLRKMRARWGPRGIHGAQHTLILPSSLQSLALRGLQSGAAVQPAGLCQTCRGCSCRTLQSPLMGPASAGCGTL